MKLITFGLGGAKAVFLRLGFGSAAAQTEDRVHGGILRGQFKPAILRPPILLDVNVVSRGRITLSGRGRVERKVAAVARVALSGVSGRSFTAAHRSSTSQARFLATAAARSVCTKAHRGRVPVSVSVCGISTAVRSLTTAQQIRVIGRGHTSGGKHHRAAGMVACAGRATVARIATSRNVSHLKVGFRVRARTDCSTLASRIEAADRRDLDLISLLAA